MTRLYRVAGGLLEAPRFDPALGLVFSDALNGGLFALSGAGVVETLVDHRRGIAGLALHEDGAFVVTGRNVAHKPRDVDGAPSPTTVLLDAAFAPHAIRFNDLTAGPMGRLYVGSITEDVDVGVAPRRPAELFLVDVDGSCRVAAADVWIPNGVTPSHDGASLYLVDSGRRAVFRFALDPETGDLADRHLFVEVDDGVPDGIAVARDGSVWVAHAQGGCVGRYDATGRRMETWPVPHPFVTSLCFGGADLRQLFVTTGAHGPGYDAEIYTAPSDVPGVETPLARVRVEENP